MPNTHRHPYALKAFNICSSLSELDAIVEASNGNPTVVLASGASLDSGPARDLLLRWSENQDNAIILTDSSRCVPRGDVGAARVLGLPGLGQKVSVGDAKFGGEAEFMSRVGNRPVTFAEGLEIYKDLSRNQRMAVMAITKKFLSESE